VVVIYQVSLSEAMRDGFGKPPGRMGGAATPAHLWQQLSEIGSAESGSAGSGSFGAPEAG
jgi:hypothetical protein